jgi:hypothetical protein
LVDTEKKEISAELLELGLFQLEVIVMSDFRKYFIINSSILGTTMKGYKDLKNRIHTGYNIYIALKSANNNLIKYNLNHSNKITNKIIPSNFDKIEYENKIKIELEKTFNLEMSRLWFYTVLQAVRSNSLHIVLTLLKISPERTLSLMEILVTSGIQNMYIFRRTHVNA